MLLARRQHGSRSPRTRTGNGDVYVLTLATGALTRLTWDDADELVNGWSRDGRWLYFSSNSHDLVEHERRLPRRRRDGGTPMPVRADRYSRPFYGAQRRTGNRTLAITARAFAGLAVVAQGTQPPRRERDLAGERRRAGSPAGRED